jgi:hypothetical protein|tara:strand:+ start:229 stop:393 length:165 start_codon:yes stop_codon:yes gene_type:complete
MLSTIDLSCRYYIGEKEKSKCCFDATFEIVEGDENKLKVCLHADGSTSSFILKI